MLFALGRLAVTADQALFVGDSGVDCACAHSAGVAFAAHLGGYATRYTELLPNDLTFDRFEQLVAWVFERESNCAGAAVA